MLPRFPFLFLKLHTQVDQLHLSIWLMCHELSHVGGPWRMSPLDHRLLILHFLLHNGPRCQAGTCSLITSPTTVLLITTSLSDLLGSSGPRGSCSNATIHCSSSFKHLCTLCDSVASQRARSIFTFRAVRKIHPTVPAAIHAALFGEWELTTCNAFSMPFGDPSPTSQSSTGTYAKGIVPMLYGGLWLPPPRGVSCSPHCVSC